MFTKYFKYYKAKYPEPDYSDVLDFDRDEYIKNISVIELKSSTNLPLGIIPVNKWKCYELKNHPGLIFIKNPFTCHGQRYWIVRCLQDYPKYPNIVNLNPKIFDKSIIDDWWSSLQHEQQLKQKNDKNIYDKLKNSMRWTTLGYHHDWDTKIYSEIMRNKFPDDLANLSRFFADCLEFSKYSAEAAIVNYYPIGTTLAGHTDHSESDLEAPLFSFSFGQTAVFLIGGKTREENPTAIFLKSGDIVVMSKEARLCYHAVPKVMKSMKEPWNEHLIQYQEKDSSSKVKRLKANEDNDDDDKKLLQHSNSGTSDNLNVELWNKCSVDSNENFWRPFNNYLEDSRININVRQVLKEGQMSL